MAQRLPRSWQAVELRCFYNLITAFIQVWSVGRLGLHIPFGENILRKPEHSA